MPARAHRPSGQVRSHSRSSSGGSSKLGANLQITQKDPPSARVSDKAKKSALFHHEVRPAFSATIQLQWRPYGSRFIVRATYSPPRALQVLNSCAPIVGSASTQERTFLPQPCVGPQPPTRPRSKMVRDRKQIFPFRARTRAKTMMNGCRVRAALRHRITSLTRTLHQSRKPVSSVLLLSPRLCSLCRLRRTLSSVTMSLLRKPPLLRCLVLIP